jgi:3-methyladenine DNA glycosylase AlkD
MIMSTTETNKMSDYILPLQALFTENADPEQAKPMAKYMRDQFEYLGIKTPQRNALFKQFLAENGLPPADELQPVVRQLWQQPAREYQYVALGLLEKMKKQVTPEHIPLLEYLVVTKSWWDTVDGLAANAVGGLFTRHPQARDASIERWRHEENFWIRRTTLLFQLRYKHNTDEDLLFSLINENLGSDEFFINKAIGWALREYSKSNPTAVIEFVDRTPLVPLSRREALKWMKNKGLLVDS